MHEYEFKIKIQTKTGGVEKPADASIKIIADSPEEAQARLRSACARIMAATSDLDLLNNANEYMELRQDGHYLRGSVVVGSRDNGVHGFITFSSGGTPSDTTPIPPEETMYFI